MPNVIVMLPHSDATVGQAMVADLAKQVQDLLNLNYVKEVRFIDDQGRVATPSTQHGKTNLPNDRYAQFSGSSQLWIDATEEINENGWTTMVQERDEQYPLFIDRDLGVNIQPIVTPADLKLKFRFTTPNRDEATRWRNNLLSRLQRVQEGMQHTLTFSVNLPSQIWELITDIYMLREKQGGYGDTLLEYIQYKSSNDLTLVSEASGEQTNLSFARRLARVNGRFLVSAIPEKPQFQEGENIWECVMEYQVTYDRPIACRIRYPIMIHNQFLPDKYINFVNQDYNPREDNWNRNLSQQAFAQFETMAINGYNCKQDAYIHIPSIDDFVMRSYPKGTATIFLGMVQMEDTSPKPFFNLRDLGDVNLDEDLLKFLAESDYSFLNQPQKSFFGLNLFRNDALVHPSKIHCDANLNIYTSEEKNIRDTYRVRLFLYVDACLVDHAAYDRLSRFPGTLVKYVQAVNEAMRYNVDFSRYAFSRRMEPWMLSSVWRMLNGMKPAPEFNYGIEMYDEKTRETAIIPKEAWYSLKHSQAMRTVQISSIMVHRKT